MKRRLLIQDEITSALSRKQDYNSFADAVPTLVKMLLQGAKRGLYSILLSQMPSMLAKAALNSSCVMSFNQNSETETRELYNPLLLKTREQQAELGALPRRTALICRHAVFPCPVKLYTPDFTLGSLNREQCDMLMAPVLDGLMQTVVEVVVDDVKVVSEEERKELDNSYLRVMKHIVKHPGYMAEEIGSDLALSPATISKYLRKAEKDEYIERVAVPLGIGNPSKLPQLTEKGEAAFGKADTGRGGVVHFFFQHRKIPQFYQEHLTADYTFQIECFIDKEHATDIAILKDCKPVIAVEVEISASSSYDHAVANVEKCLEAGFSKVISACPTQREADAVAECARHRLTEVALENAVFTSLSQFLKQKDGSYRDPERFLPEV